MGHVGRRPTRPTSRRRHDSRAAEQVGEDEPGGGRPGADGAVGDELAGVVTDARPARPPARRWTGRRRASSTTSSTATRVAPGYVAGPAALLHAARRPEALAPELLGAAHVHQRHRRVGRWPRPPRPGRPGRGGRDPSQPVGAGRRRGRPSAVQGRPASRQWSRSVSSRRTDWWPYEAHQPQPDGRAVAVEHHRRVGVDARAAHQRLDRGPVPQPVVVVLEIGVDVPQHRAGDVALAVGRTADVHLDHPARRGRRRWASSQSASTSPGRVAIGVRTSMGSLLRSFQLDPTPQLVGGHGLEERRVVLRPCGP